MKPLNPCFKQLYLQNSLLWLHFLLTPVNDSFVQRGIVTRVIALHSFHLFFMVITVTINVSQYSIMLW
ncbi:Uncharacterised protein [Klebsiella pneumoniae]|nr:Uncharacterised protein [Klebsiella pneumoniae]